MLNKGCYNSLVTHNKVFGSKVVVVSSSVMVVVGVVVVNVGDLNIIDLLPAILRFLRHHLLFLHCLHLLLYGTGHQWGAKQRNCL